MVLPLGSSNRSLVLISMSMVSPQAMMKNMRRTTKMPVQMAIEKYGTQSIA